MSDFIFYDQGIQLIFGKKLMTFSAWRTQFIGQGRGFCSLKLCDSYVVELTIGNSIFFLGIIGNGIINCYIAILYKFT